MDKYSFIKFLALLWTLNYQFLQAVKPKWPVFVVCFGFIVLIMQSVLKVQKLYTVRKLGFQRTQHNNTARTGKKHIYFEAYNEEQ